MKALLGFGFVVVGGVDFHFVVEKLNYYYCSYLLHLIPKKLKNISFDKKNGLKIA